MLKRILQYGAAIIFIAVGLFGLYVSVVIPETLTSNTANQTQAAIFAGFFSVSAIFTGVIAAFSPKDLKDMLQWPLG